MAPSAPPYGISQQQGRPVAADLASAGMPVTDDHTFKQIGLLLTISCTLLVLPWGVRHPGFLAGALGLGLTTPVVGSFVRGTLREAGLALVSFLRLERSIWRDTHPPRQLHEGSSQVVLKGASAAQQHAGPHHGAPWSGQALPAADSTVVGVWRMQPHGSSAAHPHAAPAPGRMPGSPGGSPSGSPVSSADGGDLQQQHGSLPGQPSSQQQQPPAPQDYHGYLQHYSSDPRRLSRDQKLGLYAARQQQRSLQQHEPQQ